MAIREGKWDCKTCDRKGNRGPDSYCGSCGAPRPDDVQFYLPDDAAEVTDEAKLKEAAAGADWKCSYCSTQNNAVDNFCVSCGNKKDAAQGDVSLKEREIRFDAAADQPAPADAPVKQVSPVAKKLKFALIAAFGIVTTLVVLSMFTSDVSVTVTGHEYAAKVSFEEYKLVTEEDWTLPPGAQKLGEFRAIHHYDKIADGSETKTRQVKVKVREEKVKVGVKDLGNGYFQDIYENKPVYETKTETYSETKYREVPVYMNKYRYSMMKWTREKPAEFNGSDRNPSFSLKVEELKRYPDRYRNINIDVKYFLTVRESNGETHRDDVKYETWQKAEMNSSLTAEKSTVFGIFHGIKE